MPQSLTLVSQKALRRVARIAKATGTSPIMLSTFSGFDPERKSPAQRAIEAGEKVVAVRVHCLPHYPKPTWGVVAFRKAEPDWAYALTAQLHGAAA